MDFQPPSPNSSLESSHSNRRLTRSQAFEKVLAPGLKKTPRRLKMPDEVELVTPAVQNSAAQSFTDILKSYEYDFGEGLVPPRVPLCRLRTLEIVRSLNADGPGVQNLRESFLSNGYVSDFPKFQVLIRDENGNSEVLTNKIREGWDALSIKQNADFEAECDQNAAFAVLKDKLFFVGDGNHRLHSWLAVASEHAHEIRYHPRVICKFLSGDKLGMLHIVSALHALNAVIASHVENSWILEADHVNRLLQQPLETYQTLIDADNYRLLLQARGSTRNKSWYSHQMSAKAVKYLLSAAQIKAGAIRLRKRYSTCAEAGQPISDEVQKSELKANIESHLAEWNVKIPKMTAILNPEYEPFFEHCRAMYNWAERTRNDGQREDDATKKTVQCGLDKCRVYTSVSNISNSLRCNLLEAGVKPSHRARYHYPVKQTEADIKVWVSRCGMWETVAEFAMSGLQGILDEIISAAPLTRFDATINDASKGLRDVIAADLTKYVTDCQFKFFPTIWVAAKGEKTDVIILKKRAKRLLYRFILSRESVDRQYFWIYPGCFAKWVDSDCPWSMYPGEGLDPPRQMSTWEISHCPWYIESDNWSIPIDKVEGNSFRLISKGEIPPVLRCETKESENANEEESAKEIESCLTQFVPNKEKTRKLRKVPVLPERNQKKDRSKDVSIVTAKQTKKRKSNNSEDLSDKSVGRTTTNGRSVARKATDVGSAKKPKGKGKRKFLDKLDEAGDAEDLSHHLRVGVSRPSAFKGEVCRHILFETSVMSSTKELAKTSEPPAWTNIADSWTKNILKLGLRSLSPKFDGRKRSGVFADLGFIYLPTGLRPQLEDDSVPLWNTWDAGIPSRFFNFMRGFLADDGYIAVLHSGEFDHTCEVRNAAAKRGLFKHVRSYQIFLSLPMWKSDMDVQVQIISLEIFCQTSFKFRLPKSSDFLPVWSEEDPSVRTLMTLNLPANGTFPEAGSGKLPVGFMQSVIELLTRPEDIVQDWTIGDGSSFWAGDYCGRHVIGMEERSIFGKAAADALEAIFEIGKSPSKDNGDDKHDDDKELGTDDETDKLFDLMNRKGLDDGQSSDEVEGETWRTEQRLLLRKKIAKMSAFISPEKPFILPVYAERNAMREDERKVELKWESKRSRSVRGADGKFLRCDFVDDIAKTSEYVDVSAESTSRTSSFEATSSEFSDDTSS